MRGLGVRLPPVALGLPAFCRLFITLQIYPVLASRLMHPFQHPSRASVRPNSQILTRANRQFVRRLDRRNFYGRVSADVPHATDHLPTALLSSTSRLNGPIEKALQELSQTRPAQGHDETDLLNTGNE